MEVNSMIRVKPFKGKFLFKHQAEEINEALLNSEKPERSKLQKEADEFIEFIKRKRASAK